MSDLTVLELGEELRKLGLVATGCKSELVARLNRSTPSGTWSELPMESDGSHSDEWDHDGGCQQREQP
jgi:hypothetical protein